MESNSLDVNNVSAPTLPSPLKEPHPLSISQEVGAPSEAGLGMYGAVKP